MADVEKEVKSKSDGPETDGSSVGSTPEGLDGAVSLEDQLASERDKLKEQLMRVAADFENFRKRSRRDIEDAERRGKEDTLREILPVIDNLERAVAAADRAPDAKAVADGVRMVLKLFEDVSGRLSLERVKTVGERFDPNLHEAIQQIETSEHPPGTVVSEIAPGYKLGERLLRAALVVVARPNVNVQA